MNCASNCTWIHVSFFYREIHARHNWPCTEKLYFLLLVLVVANSNLRFWLLLFFCCILIARCLEITEHLDICSIYCKRWKQLRKNFSRYLFVAYDLHDRNHSIHFQDCTANHKNKTKNYVRDKVFLYPKIQSYDYIASKILYS